MEQLPYIVGHGKIIIGEGVRLSGKPSIGFANRWILSPELFIGDHTFIVHQCSFAIAKSITIGDRCLIAAEVQIQDNDGHPIDAIRRRDEPCPLESVRPVVIGNDVWIGSRATILKGVTIGARSIVGAQAVVTKDVPPDSIVAGNPARVIRTIHSGSSMVEIGMMRV